MYPEYNKVKNYISRAQDLLNTSRKMEDIFNMIMHCNAKRVCAEYYNDNNKIARYTYKKMEANCYKFARYISEQLKDAEKNKPVIIKLTNGPHWGEIFWAILMSGYKPLLVSASTAKDGTQNLANQAHCAAIITDDAFPYETKKIAFEDIICDAEEGEFSPTWENEAIFCSSGTTGDVKLMIYNGENLCHQIGAALSIPENSKDLMYPKSMGKIKILAMVPLHHIFGFVAVLLWFTFYGSTLVYPTSNAPSDLLGICQKVGITHVFSVPLLWDSVALSLERKMEMQGEKMKNLLDNMIKYNCGEITKKEAGKSASNIVKHVVQKKLLGTHVRYCISGGGFLSNHTLRVLNGIGYNLYNGYGMTELGVTSVEQSIDVSKRLEGKIGSPFYGIQYKIVKSDENATGGELAVKSPITHVREIIGGVEKPTTLDDEGYFLTGDIAELDETGRCTLKGRIKDIIINADGENIFPDELEIYFKTLPFVKQLSVLGVKAENDKNEEKVCLVLELDNSVKKENIKEIKKIVDETKLPNNVKIQEIYLAKGKLPVANNMKVKRFVIKKAIESDNGEYISMIQRRKTTKKYNFDAKTVEEILVPMRAIFSKILVLPEFKIEDNGHWINDLGGDSMSYIELVRDVDETFGVEIPEEQYGQLTCVNDFVNEVALLKKEKAN